MPFILKNVFEKSDAGYLYNYQTKEFYNLTYAHEQPEGSARFGGLPLLPFNHQPTKTHFESWTTDLWLQKRKRQDYPSNLALYPAADYFATKCGVLMMSLFVFFTTTMSVSFTLRETQTRMLKFTGLFF